VSKLTTEEYIRLNNNPIAFGMFNVLNHYQVIVRSKCSTITINNNKPTEEELNKSDIINRMFDLYKIFKEKRMFDNTRWNINPIVTILLENKYLIKEFKQRRRKRIIKKIIG